MWSPSSGRSRSVVGQVAHDIDAVLGQVIGRPDTGEHQHLWGVDRSATQDHLLLRLEGHSLPRPARWDVGNIDLVGAAARQSPPRQRPAHRPRSPWSRVQNRYSNRGRIQRLLSSIREDGERAHHHSGHRPSDMERPVKRVGLSSCGLRFRARHGSDGRAAPATVDHSDIRGSRPHGRHPSGATSD